MTYWLRQKAWAQDNQLKDYEQTFLAASQDAEKLRVAEADKIRAEEQARRAYAQARTAKKFRRLSIALATFIILALIFFFWVLFILFISEPEENFAMSGDKDFGPCLDEIANTPDETPSCELAITVALESETLLPAWQLCQLSDEEGASDIFAAACDFVLTNAEVITMGGSVSGEIAPSGRELWRFDGEAGQDISVFMAEDNSSLDPILGLFGPDKTLVAEDDDGGDGQNSLIEISLPVSGTYFIHAIGYSDSSGAYELFLAASEQ